MPIFVCGTTTSQAASATAAKSPDKFDHSGNDRNFSKRNFSIEKLRVQECSKWMPKVNAQSRILSPTWWTEIKGMHVFTKVEHTWCGFVSLLHSHASAESHMYQAIQRSRVSCINVRLCWQRGEDSWEAYVWSQIGDVRSEKRWKWSRIITRKGIVKSDLRNKCKTSWCLTSEKSEIWYPMSEKMENESWEFGKWYIYGINIVAKAMQVIFRKKATN